MHLAFSTYGVWFMAQLPEWQVLKVKTGRPIWFQNLEQTGFVHAFFSQLKLKAKVKAKELKDAAIYEMHECYYSPTRSHPNASQTDILSWPLASHLDAKGIIWSPPHTHTAPKAAPTKPCAPCILSLLIGSTLLWLAGGTKHLWYFIAFRHRKRLPKTC